MKEEQHSKKQHVHANETANGIVKDGHVAWRTLFSSLQQILPQAAPPRLSKWEERTAFNTSQGSYIASYISYRIV